MGYVRIPDVIVKMNLKTTLSLLAIWLPISLVANVAQPGIYQAGGTRTFSLLFPEDSATFKKISMAREEVSVLLYPGFAVVKGQYWLQNDEDSTLSFHVGYPVNAMMYHDDPEGNTANIWFPDLYSLRVKINGIPVEVKLDSSLRYGQTLDGLECDWYVWSNEFPAHAETLVEVYFLVNTNEAQILQGYDKNHDQVFMYVLETGSIWKGAIGEGIVKIQGRGGIDLIQTASGKTALGFFIDSVRNALVVQFQNQVPSAPDNIIVRLGAHEAEFDFSAIMADATAYFLAVDQWELSEIAQADLRPITLKDPFEYHGFSGGSVIGFLMILVFTAPYWIGGLLLLFAIWFVVKRLKRAK